MTKPLGTAYLASGKRLSVLDADPEHRTGLGLARADPAALAGLARQVASLKSPTVAAVRWADVLAARIVAGTGILLLGLSGLFKPGVRTKGRESH